MSKEELAINNDTFRYYLRDLGDLLKKEALEAREEKDKQIDEASRAYHLGYLMAMHTVISLMQQQADSFGIPRKLLELDDIDPERQLL